MNTINTILPLVSRSPAARPHPLAGGRGHPHPAGRGPGGGKLLLHHASASALHGAGGNGGSGDGGVGGDGGSPAQPGQNGESGGTGGEGGCGGCTLGPNGDAGGDTGSDNDSGAGGGGGGGYLGGGQDGNDVSGGGGGGGGASFEDGAVTIGTVFFTTSQLAGNGSVVLSWPAGTMADADRDGVPDAVDRCGPSDRSPTVVIEACDSGAGNDLDVDGCTTADRVAQLAAGARNQGQFVSVVMQLINRLSQQGLITKSEKQALRRCAAAADMR